MRRLFVILLVVGLVMALAVPAMAIVHPTSPVTCVAESVEAGGVQAFVRVFQPGVAETPVGPPFPADPSLEQTGDLLCEG